MNPNFAQYKADLDRLVRLGHTILRELIFCCCDENPSINRTVKLTGERPKETFAGSYQRWYTESCEFIRLITPGRIEDFQSLYKPDKGRKLVDSLSYRVQDYLLGIRASINQVNRTKRFDDAVAIIGLMQSQLSILEASQTRFESTLFDIRSLVQAEILDSEMDQARELLKSGFVRAAGVIGGVALETHLAQVVDNHSLSTTKKKPTINDFNELLKNNNVIDTPIWRNIQWIGDIRNACAHGKADEPSKDDLHKMLADITRLNKTLH